MAGGTTIGQSRSDYQRILDVAQTIARQRSLSLGPGKLTLEELATPANRAEGIPGDYERRGVRRENVPATCADLLSQRLVDSFVSGIRRLRFVGELRENRR